MHGNKLPRRIFLKSGFAALAVAGVGPVAFFGGNRRARAGDAGAADMATFEGWTGAAFRFGDRNEPPLELVAVEDGPPSSRVEQFAAVFRGQRGAGLPEGVYELSAPDGRPLALFLQPTGSDAYGDYHVAQFALMRPLGPPACA